jgi:hypothetical protein
VHKTQTISWEHLCSRVQSILSRSMMKRSEEIDWKQTSLCMRILESRLFLVDNRLWRQQWGNVRKEKKETECS